MTYAKAYCSGARRANVAVCGSLSDRPREENGVWVSPTKSKAVIEDNDVDIEMLRVVAHQVHEVRLRDSHLSHHLKEYTQRVQKRKKP